VWQHGFVCRCASCELSGEALAASDARMRALGELCRPGEFKMPAPALLRLIELRLRFVNEEGLPTLWVWKPHLFALVSSATAELRRGGTVTSRQRIAAWAKPAYQVVRCGLGTDHPATCLAFSLLEQLVSKR
jgi:hypothetical protein